jgi:hypothetical protein
MLKMADFRGRTAVRPVARSPRKAGEGDYGVRKRSFRPTLKRQLQHSEQVSEPLPSPTQWEKGWGEGGLPLASAQSDQPCQPRA